MSTPVAIGDIVLAKVYCYQNSQLGINDIHLKVGTISGTPIYDTQCVAWDTKVSALWKPVLATTAEYYGASLRRLQPTQTVEFGATNNTGAGTAGTLPIPLAVAGLISVYTGVPGRKGRGRIYVPFPSTTFLGANSEPTAGTYPTLLGLIAAAVFTPFTLADLAGNSATYFPVLYSRPIPLRTVVATAVPRGTSVTIFTVGTTDWTMMGSPNNNVDTVFTTTALGNGNGTCQIAPVAAQNTLITNYIIRSRWGTQHRRGDFGRLNVLPF